MRAYQLREMVEPYLGDKVDFSVSTIPAEAHTRIGRARWAACQPSDAIFFFTKGAVSFLGPITAFLLKAKGGKICADYVDGDVEQILRREADVHIASSLKQARQIADLQSAQCSKAKSSGAVFTLLHAADTRLFGVSTRVPKDRLRMAYVGERSNCWIGDDLAKWIDVIPAGNRVEFESSLARLENYNAHYCVRPTLAQPYVTKPFTKGMIAAACGAVPLLTRSTPDAEELLGSNYPYFVETNSFREIASKFHEMQSDFGGPRWNDALKAVIKMGELTSPKSTAARMEELIRSLSQGRLVN